MRRPPASTLARRLTLGLLAAALAFATAPLAADDYVELDPAVQESLLTLQDQWIQWLTAFNTGDAEGAAGMVENMLTTTDQLGMRSLPDLSLAAMVRGVETARQGEFARARLALESAERLAPGRPETAFARATVHRLEGRWFAAGGDLLAGYARLLTSPSERPLLTANLALWLIYTLLLAGGLFVAFEMVVNGGRLVRDLGLMVGRGERGLPTAVLLPIAVILLFWPLFLPGGVAWLVLYWSMLLWTYGSTSERTAIAVVWLVAALSPWAIGQLRDQVALELTPPVRAMDRVVAGQLYGGLFADLGALTGMLTDEPAVDHLFADLHRRLGQWDRARALYRRVVTDEPDNVSASIDLASYYFYKSDFGTATGLLEEASQLSSPQQALAYFNLAQTYGSSYYFEEQAQALAAARSLGDPDYSDWVDATGEGNVVYADGGYARVDEIRRRIVEQSAEAGGGEGRRVETLRQLWSLAVVFAFAIAALVFHAVRSRLRTGGHGGVRSASRWERILMPGLTSLEEGRGLAALLALLPPVTLLVAALGSSWAYELPLGYAGGALLPLAVIALVLLYAARAWTILREA